MKFLFFCNFPPPFTGQTIGTKIIHDLVATDVNAEVINTSTDPGKVRESGSFSLSRLLGIIGTIGTLRARLKRKDIKVLYMVFSSSTLGFIKDLICVLMARKKVTKVIGHIHSGNYDQNFSRTFFKRWAPILVKHTDSFVFLSEMLYDKCHPHIPKEKSRIIPNTIQKELLFDDDEINDKIISRQHRQHLNVVYLSNMIPEKGYMYLAKALESINRKEVAFKAHFIGRWNSDKEEKQLQHFLESNELLGKVEVHGAVSDRDFIKKILSETDIFILPTFYPVEAQPISIIEALNSGSPVVSTRHATIPEFVKDGENGILVRPQEVDSIVEAIMKLQDPQEWAIFAKKARKSFIENFEETVVKQKLLEAFID